jgi:hypothetical protein
MGAAFLGAVVLAVVALCLRSVLFERALGETYRTPSEALAALLRAVAAGTATPEQLRQLEEEKAELLYEAWMGDPALDPQGRLARQLLARRGAAMMERARRTLALGTVGQRERAVELLGFVPEGDLRSEAVDLCRRELRLATRRGEHELAARARRVLE